jgi:hypothetical protein
MNVIKIHKFIFFIVFKMLFNNGNRKHFFRGPAYTVTETLVEVPTQFLVSPKLPRVFYNSIETRKMFSISYIFHTCLQVQLCNNIHLTHIYNLCALGI